MFHGVEFIARATPTILTVLRMKIMKTLSAVEYTSIYSLKNDRRELFRLDASVMLPNISPQRNGQKFRTSEIEEN